MDKIKRIKISKNFYLDEYIPKKLYLKYHIHKPHYLIGRIDKRIVEIDQFLRNRFGQATINNWISGGEREWSGLRTPESPYFSENSQHSFGRASDSIYKLASAKEIREDIKKNYTSLYKDLGLTCIEDDVTWLHKDCRYHTFSGYENTGLLIVKP